MKLIYYTNLIILILVIISAFINPLFLIITIVPLAIIQVITALYFVTKRNKISDKNQKLLSIYFLIIFGCVIFFLIISVLPNSFEFLAELIAPIPFLLAVYLVYICFVFQKQHYINKNQNL
ncbi:hypothetical protein [Polaribacter sp. R77954]|uniref:hypothetical protein n=1 Tax=Polaribacter sp. R77954 TaxID=3093870 RepID=UPI0037C7DA43